MPGGRASSAAARKLNRGVEYARAAGVEASPGRVSRKYYKISGLPPPRFALTRAALRRSTLPTIREAKVPDPDEQRRMAEFEQRLAAAKEAQAPKPRGDEHYSQAQLAWRMVIELVAGLAIGFGIGFGLDSLLGTMPFLLVVFTLLGFAAGIKTMLRSAREVEQAQQAADGGDETDEGD